MMRSNLSIRLYTKALAYKEIEPCARALGMQVLILDPKTYKWSDDLERKFKTFNISDSELSAIRYELEDGQAVVILKSKTYYGALEITPHFAKFGLSADSIHCMCSSNDDRHGASDRFYGSIPPKKGIFLYWIPLEVLDENDDPVLEECARTYSREKILESLAFWRAELKRLEKDPESQKEKRLR